MVAVSIMSGRNPPLYGTLVLFAMHAETPKAETKYLSAAQFRLVLTVMLYIHTRIWVRIGESTDGWLLIYDQVYRQ